MPKAKSLLFGQKQDVLAKTLTKKIEFDNKSNLVVILVTDCCHNKKTNPESFRINFPIK